VVTPIKILNEGGVEGVVTPIKILNEGGIEGVE